MVERSCQLLARAGGSPDAVPCVEDRDRADAQQRNGRRVARQGARGARRRQQAAEVARLRGTLPKV